MFPELRDKSNNLSVVDRLSIMTSARTGLLLLQICERCKHSRESIYLSENDFWILLALSWCQINPSFMTESRVRPQRSPLCLHFLAGPGYKACQEMACQKMSSMHATLIAGITNCIQSLSASQKLTTSLSGNFLDLRGLAYEKFDWNAVFDWILRLRIYSEYFKGGYMIKEIILDKEFTLLLEFRRVKISPFCMETSLAVFSW